MTITYPEITNLIMATDALRASLSSEKAEQPVSYTHLTLPTI